MEDESHSISQERDLTPQRTETGSQSEPASPPKAVEISLAANPEPLNPPLNQKALILGLSAVAAWIFFLLLGHEVDTRPARSLIRQLTRIGTTVVVSNENMVSIQPSRQIALQINLSQEISTNFTISLPSLGATAPAPKWHFETKDYIIALPLTLFCWIWPNLIALSAASCALSKGLSNVKSNGVSSFRVEFAWSLINGFCIVMIVVCGKIFLGDNLEKSLGINDFLSAEVLQGQYVRLAMFVSVIGLFIGLSRDRITELPKQLPIIRGMYK